MTISRAVNRLFTSWSVFGLAILLLLSPCKVRNFIEAELGIAQSKVINKSQTVLSESNCAIFELSETALASSQPESPQPLFVFGASLHFASTCLAKPLPPVPANTRIQSGHKVPIYIRFQSLKVYA
ncbi:MAG: hypothetical protein EP332_07030 [Bacteroidetes bacterium]|nr:MAG: hypothetical protein EP332_07030 [Bacteroidota bacterium]